jgi:hypothetical protein
MLSVSLMALGGDHSAQRTKIEMHRELDEKGIDLNDLAQQGRKGHKRPARSNAAAVKRASRKRRNVAKHPRSAHKRAGAAGHTRNGKAY